MLDFSLKVCKNKQPLILIPLKDGTLSNKNLFSIATGAPEVQCVFEPDVLMPVYLEICLWKISILALSRTR